MLEGFKKFIARGSVVDLAVGVIIGAAFNSVVSALVKDLLSPLIGVFSNSQNFAELGVTIGKSTFMYGDFLNALISFFLVATATYFFVVIPMNALVSRIKKGEDVVDPTEKICPECLSKIPIHAKRCAFCTVILGQ